MRCVVEHLCEHEYKRMSVVKFLCNFLTWFWKFQHRMGMGVHAAGTAAGWGQGLPGGPQLPPHHATTVTAPPGVQAAPPPPPPPAQMMAYPMQQFQVNIFSFSISLSHYTFIFPNACSTLLVFCILLEHFYCLLFIAIYSQYFFSLYFLKF